jgi:hypothetical protein
MGDDVFEPLEDVTHVVAVAPGTVRLKFVRAVLYTCMMCLGTQAYIYIHTHSRTKGRKARARY